MVFKSVKANNIFSKASHGLCFCDLILFIMDENPGKYL